MFLIVNIEGHFCFNFYTTVAEFFEHSVLVNSLLETWCQLTSYLLCTKLTSYLLCTTYNSLYQFFNTHFLLPLSIYTVYSLQSKVYSLKSIV